MQSTKKCNKCLDSKSLTEFHKDSQKTDGLRPRCKQCTLNKVKEYQTLNKEAFLAQKKEYRLKNRDAINYKNSQYYLANRQDKLDKGKVYRVNNKPLTRFHRANYRAAKSRASIGFSIYKDEIKHIYLACPDGYEVDHIFPLRGKTICGLHVPWNLQYLTKTENSSKNNRMPDATC